MNFMPGIGQPINPAQMAQTGQAWSPQQMAQGLEMFRGQGATLGNPEAVQANQQQNLAQLMEAYKSAHGQAEMGAQMAAPEYVQNSGGLGALAMIAQAVAGTKMRKEANESASDYAGRIFAEEQRMAQQQAEAAAKAEEAARQRDWAREDSRDETRAQREERLAMMRIDAADRRTAQQAQARIAAARIAAARIGASGQAPSGQDRPDRPDPVAMRDAADRARASAESLVTLGELNQLHKDGGMFGGISTGPLDQWLPGPAGQRYDQLSNTLNLSSLRSNFGGNPAEGERAANLETLPARNRYETVNQDRIEQMRAQMVGRIEAYNRMPGAEPIAAPEWALTKAPAPQAPPPPSGNQGGGMPRVPSAPPPPAEVVDAILGKY